MSALGQKQTFTVALDHVRFQPKADIRMRFSRTDRQDESGLCEIDTGLIVFYIRPLDFSLFTPLNRQYSVFRNSRPKIKNVQISKCEMRE